MSQETVVGLWCIATPLLIIIGDVLYKAMKEYRVEQRRLSRSNHPTSKGLPRK